MAYDEPHSRPERHGSGRIAGTRCDGCRAMSVIVRSSRLGNKEEYYCDRRHEKVDPFAVECAGVIVPERRPKGFNKGKL